MPVQEASPHSHGRRAAFELPPTAGLPGVWSDIFRKPSQGFAPGLEQWLHIPKPIFTCSGTAALMVCLSTMHALKPERNTIIVPAYTCPLVPLAVNLVPGLQTIACDTAPNSIDFDPQALARICNEQTLAVIPTHLGGRVADVSTAKDIAYQYGAFVVEDAAQALGAFTIDDSGQAHSVGLMGDAAFFSLAAGKGLTTYEGGLLFSRHPQLHSQLETMGQTLLKPNLAMTLRRIMELMGYYALYRPSRLWHVYGRSLVAELDRGNEVAAVGDYFKAEEIPLHSLDAFRLRIAANALARLPHYLEQGRLRAEKRLTVLRAIQGMQIIEDTQENKGVWPFFMLLLPTSHQRDAVLRTLWRKGWGVSKLFINALPDYDFLASTLAPAQTKYPWPHARDLAARMLTITNSHWLTEELFLTITAEIEQVL